MDVRFGLWRKLSTEELMLLNCGVGEDSWESLGLQGDPTSPFWRRSALGFLWRDWCWSWNSSTLAPHAKSWLIGKDSDAARDWGQEEKGTTEDEMAGWLHPLDEREFEWIPGDCDGQGGLACCDSWGRKELDTTEQLNWTDIFPGISQVVLVVKNPLASARDVRDMGSILGSGKYPGEGMATHSSILAWRIPWTEEPGVLQSIGWQRVRHNGSNLARICFHLASWLHVICRVTCWSANAEKHEITLIS